jgi:hypothetical protein
VTCPVVAYSNNLLHGLLLCVCCACRALLRLQLWRSSKCTLALEAVSREDQEQHECEQQLQELLQVRGMVSSTAVAQGVVMYN